ncbi:MAG TPA: 2-oxo acid dehydrogenase subunit E2 [Methylocystis sp.]|nr:2-oxo acid dehydrogenase subunit E2 [Methylocystis sp.]
MTAAAAQSSETRIFASPLARRLAREAGLDLSQIKGSGPHGRIVERDVAARAQEPVRSPVREAAAPKLQLIESFEEIPLDSMRKTIARRMTEAAQGIPHFYLTCDCEIDALLRLREEINAAAPDAEGGKPAWKISVNDFIVKALAQALQDVPDANVTFAPEALQKHRASDIGVAVAIPGGLITPIVRGAESKSLREISVEIKELSQRAKERRLKPLEYEGGVSAVSNLGMFGVRNFTAIINPPQSTILAVGAGEPRVVVKNGAPAVATLVTVTLSCDHRAVDGALGAQLLAAFKRAVEHPAAMLA